MQDCFYAAFLVDPMHYVRNGSGHWVPPITQLRALELAAAKACIKRLVVHSELQAAAFDTEWANYGLSVVPEPAAGYLPVLTDKTYASDGKLMVAGIEQRRTWWATHASQQYPLLAKAAAKLLAMHVTTCAAERNWSQWGLLYTKQRNRLAIATAEKMIYVRANLLSAKEEQLEQWNIAAQLMLEEDEELELMEIDVSD